jgi:hypothetical protein
MAVLEPECAPIYVISTGSMESMLPSSVSAQQSLSSLASAESGPTSGHATYAAAHNAGYIDKQKNSPDLMVSVESLSENYSCAEQELKQKGIVFSDFWRLPFRTVAASVETLDRAREEALRLLTEDETDATTRKLHRLDKESAERLD